jgi:hypothetical protein
MQKFTGIEVATKPLTSAAVVVVDIYPAHAPRNGSTTLSTIYLYYCTTFTWHEEYLQEVNNKFTHNISRFVVVGPYCCLVDRE